MKNPFERIEQKESGEFGNNVEIDVELARHGEKGSFNASRIANPEKVVELAKGKDLSGYDVVAVRTTPIERAVHTGMKIEEGFESNDTFVMDDEKKKVNLRVRDLPTGVISKEGVIVKKIMNESSESKDVNLISPQIRQAYKEATEKSASSSLKKENAGVALWIKYLMDDLDYLKKIIDKTDGSKENSDKEESIIKNFKDKQVKEDGISVLEVVLRMTEHFKKYVEASNRLKNDSKVFVYDVNHAGFIEPFLVYLLQDQIEEDPVCSDGSDILEKMGGAFEPNEAVNISIKRKEKNGKVSIKFRLRGKEYDLDVEPDKNIFTKSGNLLKEITIADVISGKRNGGN